MEQSAREEGTCKQHPKQIQSAAGSVVFTACRMIQLLFEVNFLILRSLQNYLSASFLICILPRPAVQPTTW